MVGILYIKKEVFLFNVFLIAVAKAEVEVKNRVSCEDSFETKF